MLGSIQSVDFHILHSVSIEISFATYSNNIIQIIRIRFFRLRRDYALRIIMRAVISSPNTATQTILKKRKDDDIVMTTPYIYNTVR